MYSLCFKTNHFCSSFLLCVRGLVDTEAAQAADGDGRQRGTMVWDGCSHLLLGAHQRPQLLHRLTQLLSAALSSSRVSQLSLQLCHLPHTHSDRPFKTGSELTGSSQWRNGAVHHRRELFSFENFCKESGRCNRISPHSAPSHFRLENIFILNCFSFLL